MHTLMASEEETGLASRLLAIAHCEQTGVLTAQAAIELFGRSGLTFEELRDIWNMADRNNTGELSRDELTMAIRLMGWVQAGEAVHVDLLTKAGPLPTLEGISDVRKPNHVQFPPINPDEIRKYREEFSRAGPVAGMLQGESAMSTFVTASNLSYEQLGKILKLADTNARGVLDFRQFALGMYLINAFQSCLIPTIPNSIPHNLSDKFADIALSEPEPPTPASLHHSISFSNLPTQLRITPPVSGSSTPLPSINTNGNGRLEHSSDWAILPHEKMESDKQFFLLDVDNKGYIGTDAAAKFLIGYDLPQTDLGRIWMLADLRRDNRLTRDEFAIVMHLLRQRLAGEPVPETLPPSLLSPSLRVEFRASHQPAVTARSPKPPPPPPKHDRTTSLSASSSPPNYHVSRAHSVATVPSSPTQNPRYSTPLSPPLSPSISTRRPRMPSSPSPSAPFLALGNNMLPKPSSSLLSPFEDPSAELHSNSPSRSTTPIPSPPMVEKAALESLEQTHKKETARLVLVIETLREQLSEQGQLRETNANLEKEIKSLRSELRDMERTVSEVLSANDRLGSQEQYVAEIGKLTAELEVKETENASNKRVLDVLKQEQQDLRSELRESQAATTKAKTEAEEAQATVATQNTEIEDLKSRLADMTKAMSEPSSATNNRQLRVLLQDATKDNNKLKGQLRDTQKSMEQLLLSSKFTNHMDDLLRENRRLKEQIQEMTLVALTVQQTSSGSSSRDLENMARENDQLKQNVKDGQRIIADIREANEAKLTEMQQQIDSLTHENRRLKIDVASHQRRPQEDNNVPPPTYDEAFTIPP